jgi:hypothetical protein
MTLQRTPMLGIGPFLMCIKFVEIGKHRFTRKPIPHIIGIVIGIVVLLIEDRVKAAPLPGV